MLTQQILNGLTLIGIYLRKGIYDSLACIFLLAGALSGGLMVLAMPKPDFGLLAYLCLVPALTLLQEPGRRQALLVGGAAETPSR